MGDLASVLVGGALGIVGGMGIETFREFRQAKVLKQSLRTEIKTIVKLIEKRKYLELFEQSVKSHESGGALSWHQIPITKNYTNVFEANADKIGMLGSSAQDFLNFYMLLNAILDDNAMLMNAYQQLRDHGKITEAGEKFIHELQDDMVSLFKEILAIGRAV